MSEEIKSLMSIQTMVDLGRELRRRRIAAGFATLPELLKNAKHGYPLPRSTAYTLEEGQRKSNWISVEAHLRACEAQDSEIDVWRDAHRRALSNYGEQADVSPIRASEIPTVKQLAEMGPEQAARILSGIEIDRAADLLRRSEITFAARLLPELSLRTALQLLPEVGQVRTTLLFENIDQERGGELLAEMGSVDILKLLEDLDTSRSAELVASMPRGRAAKVLREIPSERAVKMLTEIAPDKAVKLLRELDFNLTITLVETSRISKIARIMNHLDRDIATEILSGHCDPKKALEVLVRMEARPSVAILESMDESAARSLMEQMPPTRMAKIFTDLSIHWQTAILSTLFNADQAARVLENIGVEDLRYVLGSVQQDRLATILMSANVHERVLMLAVMERYDRVKLTRLSDTLAELEIDLERQNLANHIARIGPERAWMYLAELDGRQGELLSSMNPEDAARIINHNGDFQEMAGMLNSVDSEMTAWILQTMIASEAASVLEDMKPNQAADALVCSNSDFADRVLELLYDRVDRRKWNEHKLTSAQWEEARSKRRKNADYIRSKLSR